MGIGKGNGNRENGAWNLGDGNKAERGEDPRRRGGGKMMFGTRRVGRNKGEMGVENFGEKGGGNMI